MGLSLLPDAHSGCLSLSWSTCRFRPTRFWAVSYLAHRVELHRAPQWQDGKRGTEKVYSWPSASWESCEWHEVCTDSFYLRFQTTTPTPTPGLLPTSLLLMSLSTENHGQAGPVSPQGQQKSLCLGFDDLGMAAFTQVLPMYIQVIFLMFIYKLAIGSFKNSYSHRNNMFGGCEVSMPGHKRLFSLD